MSETKRTTGIEALRYCVRLFNDTREDAIDGYTPRELLRIAAAHQSSGWDIYPDQWSKQQRDRAAKYGTTPTFSDRGEPIEAEISRGKSFLAIDCDACGAKAGAVCSFACDHGPECTDPICEETSEATDRGQMFCGGGSREAYALLVEPAEKRAPAEADRGPLHRAGARVVHAIPPEEVPATIALSKLLSEVEGGATLVLKGPSPLESGGDYELSIESSARARYANTKASKLGTAVIALALQYEGLKA